MKRCGQTLSGRPLKYLEFGVRLGRLDITRSGKGPPSQLQTDEDSSGRCADLSAADQPKGQGLSHTNAQGFKNN